MTFLLVICSVLLNIGVGTTSPVENFHVLGQNFAVTGVLGSGDALSLSGAGTRMFFYPQKGAFRAGTVTANQWNNGSIGNYSVAMGQNTTASGAASTALGTGTSATNSYATALGANTEASGIYSTAMGYNTVANGQNATAIGTATTASGQYAISIGNGTIASGIATTAMGQSTIASAYRETAIGSYNTIATGFSPSAWVETDRLFTIGNGAAAGAESNALVMLKNGNTTLKGALTLTDGTSFFTLPKVDGTVGQGLVTDGNGNVSWGSPTVASPYTAGTGIAIASGVISNTGDLSATNELELPTQTGNTGKYLTTDGTNVSWSSVVGSGTSLNGAYNEGGAGAGRTITANNGAVLVNGTDGLQVTGASGSGATLALSGAGTRMFFYPKKAAFRAGEVTATQWDDANIGDYSTAMGRSTKASGGGSTAIGYATTASGWASTTLGYFTNAIGAYSTAMGFSSAANGHHSMAMGLQSTSNAWGSFSLGNKATANGSYSIALGDSTKTSGISSTAMGKGTNAIAYGEMAMGLFNTIASSSNSIAFVATDRLFTIGNGTGPNNKSDALVMLKNGNTTLKGALTLTNGTSSYTLPQTDGAAGQVLITDGSGILSWTSVSGVGNTLNGAYNNGGAGAGRIITADNGAVLINGTDGFQVTGNGSSGAALALSGAGTRMFFYPQKAAFRAGNVTGTQWDDANIDYASVAMGENTIANGMAATAMGGYTIAHGSYSTAMGISSIANGMASVAIGYNAKTYNDNCIAIGKDITTTGQYALAMGYEVNTSGMFSTAMGAEITAMGDYSVAMGDSITADGRASVVIGKGLIGQSYGETVLGTHNTTAASYDQYFWATTDRLFTIGNGTGPNNKSNALVMLKNGNTTLKGALTLTNGTSSYTLPQTDGTAGQVLTTDGSGVVTWTSPSGGSSGSGGGGGTLDGSYDYGGAGIGRTITADNGAVLVQGTDGLQVTGSLGSGTSLALSGAGTKMFFYPKKAAFRAGNVGASEWDDANIGTSSTAMGRFTKASGYASTAFGDSAIASGSLSTAAGFRATASGSISVAMGEEVIASGDYSVAMGTATNATGIASLALGGQTTASGFVSTAMGRYTTASAQYTTAMGIGTTASGNYATAMGQNTIASGTTSIATGYQTTASGVLSTAIGSYSTASGDYSTAMGQAAISSGQLSTAMGHYTVASGKSSTAMGEATKAESFAETSIGMYSTSAVSPSVDNWVATDRLFTIGNGTGSGAFSDALVMLKNGNTTLKGALTLTNGASSFTLPQVDGTAGQVLTTNGSGIVSWGAAAGGGGSLNAAYNFSGAGAGRVITADDGAVVIQGSDGFQVTGTFGSGDTLSLAGTGAKMFFNPKKAAFRAGEVSAAHWNNANIGDNSTATGYNTTASGAGATAMGGFTTATTYCSVAMGNYTTASGYISTAIGSATTASGNRSTAMGSYTTASGFGSLSTGGATTASADYATATGYTTNASGIASLATGSFTVANANYSTSMGRNTTASAFGETVVGLYNTIDASANATAWASADRVFTVGNGSSANTLSNAFTVYKSGEALHGGSVMVAGDVTALTFNTLSDKRYKKNILPITSVAKQGSVLASLDAINGYYYDFRVNEFPEKKFTDAKQIGFIAQELEKVYPELVTTDAKGYKSVDYAKMTPVLLEAIKELKAQNAKIVDDLAKLQMQNAKIADDFTKLQVQNAKIADDFAKLQVQNAKIADDNSKLQVQNGKIEAKIEALENAVYGNVKR